ncbi:DUF4373 domain-containing protein [Fictibacillus aquaticus]|uniref:Lin1244/Lin1753-like N-terminal domain-containing protein n=1 Tax=Fictibacillus aquaticus TaxID=2021314 RepID=A0A235F9A0_9BACL|nr:DUF4373 domain-containing protein [Fictibacillus aquaticus]OYD57890.1 hypothetical protein CGZ90_08290 [Fictibacillus aquaticus]
MKEAFYFSHDSNARHDPKISAMRSVYGTEGYGMYWMLIEILREQEDFKLKKGKHLFNALAMQMQCKSDFAQKFVEDCIHEFDLLVEDDENIWSLSLIKRMELKETISEKRRKAAKKRWEKSSNDADSENLGMQEECKSNANAMQMQTKSNAIKEKKVKESKDLKDIRRKHVYDPASIPFQLAKRLYERILANNPAHKEPDLQKWADDMRKLIDIDGKDPRVIAKMIDWVQQNTFWHKNILSGAKLRDQYDRLHLEIQEKQNKVKPFKPREEPVVKPLEHINANNLFGGEG